MSLPVACQDCKREGKQIELCNLRTYQFSALLKKCPREPGFEPATPKQFKGPIMPFDPPTGKWKPGAVEPLATNIEIKNLELGVFSPRMQFDPTYIAKLAEDIEAEGQLKPIMVRPHPKQPEKYQVVDGEHRVRALQKLGKTLARAEVHALSDDEAYYRAMRINQLHGKALEQLEEAVHINKMIGIFGYTEEQIAKRFNRAQSWVSQRRALAVSLASKVEENVIRRLISSSHAVEIAELPKEDQELVVEKVAEPKKKPLPVRATRALVHAIKEAKTPEEKRLILSKPIETYTNLYKQREALHRSLLARPEQPVYQRLECPCGCGWSLWIQWNERIAKWEH